MKNNKKIYVLAYHSIDDLGYIHSVHINQFEKQINYLSRKYELLSHEDFCNVIEGKKQLKKNGVLITFDDGIQDNLTNALPILKNYNAPAVIFVSTSHVGTVHGGKSGYKFQFLQWKEMKTMIESKLISIQNHTHTHPFLTEISNANIEKEVSVSNELIKNNLSVIPNSIAYPKGDYDKRVREVIKDHFKYGFLVDGGYWIEGKVDPYEIPRILISQNISMLKFKIILSKSFWSLKSLKKGLKI
jgi:peptidoglycan/xylan/chitin deacetylase (PgdA/CDA1 family)